MSDVREALPGTDRSLFPDPKTVWGLDVGDPGLTPAGRSLTVTFDPEQVDAGVIVGSVPFVTVDATRPGESEPVTVLAAAMLPVGDDSWETVVDGGALEVGMTLAAVIDWQAHTPNGLVPRRHVLSWRVTPPNPVFYSQPANVQGVLVEAMGAFGGLYDNTVGGRFNWMEELQTSMSLDWLVQAAGMVASRVGGRMFPAQNLTAATFPARHSSVLVQGVVIEMVRYAMRAYTEQPNIVGSTQVPYADRRDYVQRWKLILDDLKGEWDRDVNAMRIASLNVGGSSLLVSGGIFGRGGMMGQPQYRQAAIRGVVPIAVAVPVGR